MGGAVTGPLMMYLYNFFTVELHVEVEAEGKNISTDLFQQLGRTC